MRTRLHPKSWLRRTLARGTVAVLVAGGLLGLAEPASAATSAPKAVGAGATNDGRVWEIVGTAAASRVRMTAYRPGVAGATVNNQRWQWELVASSATAGLTWRIRNVASGLCLDKNSANAVVMSTCGTATSQRWQAPLTDPYGGWVLRNGANSQCLHVAGNSTADGALLDTTACNSAASQRWRMRPAPQDCTIRSRDWSLTEVCAVQGSERMHGVTANWRHYPVTMTWLDPELYILSHSVRTYLQVRPLKPDFSQGSTGFEFGHTADRSLLPSGTVGYSAFWLEWGTSSEQYHALSTAQAPRSDNPDGRNHSFMVLGKGNAGQWDLLYDYNTVGTTSLQAGGSTRSSRSGLAVRYPQAANTTTPFGIRMQLMDGNQVWRPPYLSETGTGEPKTCETPPRYEDWVYDVVNLPPRCFTAEYTVANVTASSPGTLDSFTVAKPGTGTPAPAVAAEPSAGRAGTWVHNGVDQAALAACLETDPDACLDTVPGLAACVAARAVCNVLDRDAAPANRSVAIGPEQALRAAERTFRPVGAAGKTTVRTVELAGTSAARGGIAGAGTVHVVTSSSRVRSMSATHDASYPGYVAAYDATTGLLRYACLGTDCSELP